MAETEHSLTLASGFPAASVDDWLALAGDLERLRTTTYDGITIEPLYTSADGGADGGLPGCAPFVRGRTPASTRAGWDVRQLVEPSLGRGAAVAELERGASSVWLRLRPGATGAPDTLDAAAVADALDGVMFDVAPVVLDAGPAWAGAADALGALWAARGVDPATASGSFGADPFGCWAADRRGTDLAAGLATFAGAAGRWHEQAPRMRVATIDASRYHDAGASDSEELGIAVATTAATLRALPDTFDATAAFGALELRLAATVDQFATIAKFRAARRLLARVAEVLGEPSAAGGVALHAVTSRAMATRYDAAVNMLRATVACFAAGVAGADAITVLAHDGLLTPAGSELGRRLARNTQSVLAMESNLARVIDPAGGSWYVERFTDQLAEAAWDVFTGIEAAGGFAAAVSSGAVDARIAASSARRAADVATRRAPITGVSEFPNAAEPPQPSPPMLDDAGGGGDLPLHRWAAGFESLRHRVDAAAAKGARPAVFLATLGDPAAFTPRATFAANYFGVAGLAIVQGPVSNDPAEVAAAFAASGTPIACLSSSDDIYAECGNAAASALAGTATRLYVAGRPAGVVDTLVAAGATHTIAAGDDVLATLADLLSHLEIA